MFRIVRFCLVFLLTFSGAQAASQVHHEILVELMPDSHRIKVIDTIQLPSELLKKVKDKGLPFVLHKGELPRSQSKGLSIHEISTGVNPVEYPVPIMQFEVKGDLTKDSFTLEYEREIAHMLDEVKQGTAETAGLIDNIGVYLANESAWYPRVDNEHVTFTLTVKLPPSWSSVSQGERIYQEKTETYHVDTWQEKSPQDNIYLIAAKFHESSIQAGNVNIYAFLRQPDEELAQRYLNISSQYLSMYEELLGSFPYGKFAVVENFWETGYGMPSFTLLGERVIRLPFILYSSYPHELVHNWWGNSVYVDYSKGNWSEGLTTYLADHLLKEQQGQGANYRRDVLQKYTNFIQQGKDFSLDKFVMRQDQASEAVGYGKTMMLFHMLRKSLGDKKFTEGLQALYSDFKFKRASFADIEGIYSDLAHTDMHDFFSQWIERVGAPVLAIGQTSVAETDKEFALTLELLQEQNEAPYAVHVPVAITLEGQQFATIRMLPIQERINTVKLSFNSRPVRIDVDPFFDVFRKLDAMESPPALSRVLGAKKIVAILPSKESAAKSNAYRSMIESWKAGSYPQIEIVSDKDISSLPQDAAILILGERSRFIDELFASTSKYPINILPQGVEVDGAQYAFNRESVLLVLRNKNAADQALAFISLHDVAAAEGMTRKLPHYGKYGFLAFEGNEPVNVAKKQWPTVDSPLSRVLVSEEIEAATFPQFPALINAQ